MINIQKNKRLKDENSTIALINIVFLMLIFFLIAGTIVPPIDKNILPIHSDQTEDAEFKNILIVRRNGELFAQGKSTTMQQFISNFKRNVDNFKTPIRILPDKNLEAITLISIINQLQSSNASTIHIITERMSPP